MLSSLFIGFAAHWLVFSSGSIADTTQSLSVSIQQKAVAETKLELLDGTVTTLGEYLQQGPVYINFWALWCEPCKQELRAMKTIVKELPASSFTLLAINLDSPKSLAKVKAFVKSQAYPFPIVLDPNEQIFRSFNGQLLPFAVLMDRQGNVVSTRTAYLPGDEKEIKQDILKVIQQ
jgi:thiol-disulfide isomerase/thioredoxin